MNNGEFFGYQLVVDDRDKVLDVNNRFLIGATSLTIDKVVDVIHSLSGLVIASHIDRERFSIIGQLGFIPKDLKLDGVEVSSKISIDIENPFFHQAHNFPLITSSDAHYVEDIGKSSTFFLLKDAKVSEIKKALLNKDGRSIITYFRHS